MAKALDIVSSIETAPLLEQLAGQGKGRVFELSIDQINLGREDENDIVISDDSVSRLHAKIERMPTGEFVITDNKSKNGVVVNKQKIQSATLNHGDIIQLGHFIFRFRIPGMSSPNISGQRQSEALVVDVSSFSGKLQTNKKRIFLYGGVAILLGAALMMSKEESPKSSNEPNSKKEDAQETFKPSLAPELNEKARAKDINLEDPLLKTEKEIGKLENKENYIKESELYFRKGQRDYFNKNYHHAIDNFDAAISLWGQHPLATYYRGLAAHESEVEASKHREIGLKYYNSLQYSRAMYHFKAAIDAMAHTKADDSAAKKMIRECQSYLDYSQRKLRAAEMVP